MYLREITRLALDLEFGSRMSFSHLRLLSTPTLIVVSQTQPQEESPYASLTSIYETKRPRAFSSRNLERKKLEQAVHNSSWTATLGDVQKWNPRQLWDKCTLKTATECWNNFSVSGPIELALNPIETKRTILSKQSESYIEKCFHSAFSYLGIN